MLIVFPLEFVRGQVASKYVLWRKAGDQVYAIIKEFSEVEINNATCTFNDFKLNKTITYTYRVEARAADGSLLAESNEVALQSTKTDTTLKSSLLKNIKTKK